MLNSEYAQISSCSDTVPVIYCGGNHLTLADSRCVADANHSEFGFCSVIVRDYISSSAYSTYIGIMFWNAA